MTTIKAMKQALHLLRWTHFGECRTYPGPVPEAREVDKLLSEAIAAEEAQGVEPVAAVLNGHYQQRKDLEEGVVHELFTRPAPPPADHIGDATTLVAQRPINCGTGHCSCVECVRDTAPATERDYLIELLRHPDKYFRFSEHITAALVEDCAKAANMLAADANDAFAKGMAFRPASVQQVAVPQGPARAITAAVMRDDGGEKPAFCVMAAYRSQTDAEAALALLAAAPQPPKQVEVPQESNNDEVICPNCSTQFRAIPVNVQRLLLNSGFNPPFTDAPQPPQADALAADHVEDVRAMVPMTDQELDDLLPTNDSMSRADSLRWMARATERHHKIGVKQ